MNLFTDRAQQEPDRLTAGDTVRWSRPDLAVHYPPLQYRLDYVLRSAAGSPPVTISASGASFEALLPAAQTAGFTPGAWRWFASMVSIATGERITIGQGVVQVLPNPAMAGAVDQRTPSERLLAAIEAVLSGRATKEHEETTLADGRRIKLVGIAELMKIRDRLRADVAREQQALGLGAGIGRTLYTRFRRG